MYCIDVTIDVVCIGDARCENSQSVGFDCLFPDMRLALTASNHHLIKITRKLTYY